MPTEYIKKMAEKHGKTVDDMEEKWKRAKSLVDPKKYPKDEQFYAVATTIFKKMIGEQIMSFDEYCKIHN